MLLIEKGLQNSSLCKTVFCSLWLLLPWVIALLSALMEGEVGVTHMYKAKHIFNSLGTPGLKTFNNKTSTWNLIQLRLRSANRSHKCASFCRQQIHSLIQFPRALTAPQQPHKNLGSKTAFTAALWLLLQAVSEDLRITGWKSRGIPGVRREPLVINRQVPLLPGQRLP